VTVMFAPQGFFIGLGRLSHRLPKRRAALRAPSAEAG
jgi:hypothetical protein